MRAVIVDPRSRAGIALGERPEPEPTARELLIGVAAVSLNPGELRSRELLEQPGWMPGRDFAGVVLRAADDGSGPPVGTRVFGLVNGGAFAEVVAVSAGDVAAIATDVSYGTAASLPVAGLTALLSLDRLRGLIGRRVLVTGASGGVGHMAIQLARAAGAWVAGVVRDAERAEVARAAGADVVMTEDELPDSLVQFDFALDTVGGATLPKALRSLVRGGTCLAIGSLGGEETRLDVAAFLSRGLRLEGFYLFDELSPLGPQAPLQRLMAAVERGNLRPRVDVEAPWAEVSVLAERLLARDVTGKVVLRVSATGDSAHPTDDYAHP